MNEKSTYTPEQMRILKSQIAPHLNEDELKIFLHNCRKMDLDPFSKQIYAIKRGEQFTIQTSIDGFRAIAERTGKYAPGSKTDFTFDDKGNLICATAYIKKQTPDGTWHEVAETSFLKEYLSQRNPLWRAMPTVMLSKVSEARALRRAFPYVFSAVYCEDEMDQATSDNSVQIEEVKADNKCEKVQISQDCYEDLIKSLEAHPHLIPQVESRLKARGNTVNLREISQDLYAPILNFIRTNAEVKA